CERSTLPIKNPFASSGVLYFCEKYLFVLVHSSTAPSKQLNLSKLSIDVVIFINKQELFGLRQLKFKVG
ncbi:MAG: hypothetical protein AAB073_07690, partial [Pseudomonadota bacterium]